MKWVNQFHHQHLIHNLVTDNRQEEEEHHKTIKINHLVYKIIFRFMETNHLINLLLINLYLLIIKIMLQVVECQIHYQEVQELLVQVQSTQLAEEQVNTTTWLVQKAWLRVEQLLHSWIRKFKICIICNSLEHHLHFKHQLIKQEAIIISSILIMNTNHK